MSAPENKNRSPFKIFIFVAAALALIGAATALLPICISRLNRIPADPAYVEKLKSAQHFQSTFPAQRQTMDLYRKSGFKHAVQNALGLELREVSGMAGGNPPIVFDMLSHLGGYGEVIWVNQWSNFPVKLPPSSTPGMIVVPRRAAVRAALDALDASGACLVQAGPDRYLVAKVAEKEKYEAAIRQLGWLDGTPPPWVTNSQSPK
jgi:hypothetical protein